MSGIGGGHNKFETCENCPDRCVEPKNCHSTCAGYLFRAERSKRIKQLAGEEWEMDSAIRGLAINRYKSIKKNRRKK